ncbi:dual specificity phosphatase [Chaetomium fimeti]|uniref:protein-tyrosine-phosphatase n=1 Tax=Chaetomium fimeti TaxID=1854472 RepID=A0AAE0LPD7_9PEZI|nr:dual specificity phosphatase [Chaetomium fimeti]
MSQINQQSVDYDILSKINQQATAYHETLSKQRAASSDSDHPPKSEIEHAPSSDIERPMSEIEPGLFLGDEVNSYTVSGLASNNIGAIVTMLKVRPIYWSHPQYRPFVDMDRHMFIPCRDSNTQDLLRRMPDICDFIHQMLHGEERQSVLVHCHKGISRSATAIVAYLMRTHRQPLDAVLASVKAIRPIVRPNPNFMEQLAVWAAVGYEPWEDAARTTPKPRYAAYLAGWRESGG